MISSNTPRGSEEAWQSARLYCLYCLLSVSFLYLHLVFLNSTTSSAFSFPRNNKLLYKNDLKSLYYHPNFKVKYIVDFLHTNTSDQKPAADHSTTTLETLWGPGGRSCSHFWSCTELKSGTYCNCKSHYGIFCNKQMCYCVFFRKSIDSSSLFSERWMHNRKLSSSNME